jgi:predicted TIM-barrel fold metal-dependent hydrolase
MIVDAHMHIWNRLHGSIAGKTPLVGLANGMIKIGEGKPLLGMPASHMDSTARAEWVVAEFDAAGVDAGVVVQENMDGEQNDYCREAMARFPGRFFCHALPDFFQPAGFVKQCDQLFAQGFRGIKIPGGHLAGAGVAVDDPAFLPVWDRMDQQGFVLAIDLSEGEGQVPQVENILTQFPGLKMAIGHFGMPNRKGWPGQLRLCRHEGVYLESGGIIWLYRQEGYPFAGAIAAIREAADAVGWEKLIWGSDWPRTMVDFTYRQSLDFVRKSAEISDSHRDLFLGENAARLYNLPRPTAIRQAVPLITEG